jgi:MFS transporter, SHS family, sialic acid transporter
VQWVPSWADQLAGTSNPKAKAYSQSLSALGAVFGSLFGGWIGSRMPRRWTYFLLCLLSLGVGSFLFRSIHAFGTSFLISVTLLGLFTAAFYGWIPLYLPELFPTRVRATAQGVCFNFGRILAAVGALKMGDLMQKFGGNCGRASATIILVYVVGLFLIWLAPETKDKPLPE